MSLFAWGRPTRGTDNEPWRALDAPVEGMHNVANWVVESTQNPIKIVSPSSDLSICRCSSSLMTYVVGDAMPPVVMVLRLNEAVERRGAQVLEITRETKY
jgi:hypothetical protein